ncbi:MAG: hypothetical protein R3E96_09420 [Planctomycetota bacterium]
MQARGRLSPSRGISVERRLAMRIHAEVLLQERFDGVQAVALAREWMREMGSFPEERPEIDTFCRSRLRFWM